MYTTIHQPSSGICQLTSARPKSLTANLGGLVGLPDGDTEGSEETGTHEGPETNAEPLAAGVEGDVAVGALGVVVRRGQTSAGGVEASAGDQRSGGAGSGAGQHLERVEWRLGCDRGELAESTSWNKPWGSGLGLVLGLQSLGETAAFILGQLVPSVNGKFVTAIDGDVSS